MTTPARYLIQTRAHGQSWETRCTAQVREQADTLADALGEEMTESPFGYSRDYPTFPSVRVTCNGSVTYDPRTCSRLRAG